MGGEPVGHAVAVAGCQARSHVGWISPPGVYPSRRFTSALLLIHPTSWLPIKHADKFALPKWRCELMKREKTVRKHSRTRKRVTGNRRTTEYNASQARTSSGRWRPSKGVFNPNYSAATDERSMR